jgi:dihydrofolate reductase
MKECRNKYTAIVCTNNKGTIGNDGKLMYNIRSDKGNFQRLTDENVVIMGRRTFEEIGHPLKNRVNIILTSNQDYKINVVDEEEYSDTYICNSISDVDDLCYAYFSDKELFVIGGEAVYNQFFELGAIDKAIVTLVNDDQDGDTHFNWLGGENDDFKVIFRTTSLRDHTTDTYYRYIVYKKKC